MAGGWSKDGAVQDQIDASVEDAVDRVRARLGHGESAKVCDECGRDIPEARRLAVPGVRRCVQCQGLAEAREPAPASLFNRRGSKDSQLR